MCPKRRTTKTYLKALNRVQATTLSGRSRPPHTPTLIELEKGEGVGGGEVAMMCAHRLALVGFEEEWLVKKTNSLCFWFERFELSFLN